MALWQATISEADLPFYYTNPYRLEYFIIKAIRYIRFAAVEISRGTGGTTEADAKEMQVGGKESKLNVVC